MTSLETSGRCGVCTTNERYLVTGGPRETLAGETTELHILVLGCILYRTASHRMY